MDMLLPYTKLLSLSTTRRDKMKSFFSSKATALDAALDYADKKIPVFPVIFYKETGEFGTICPTACATTDKNAIKSWFTENSKAVVAIPTSAASGIIAIEVDETTSFTAKTPCFINVFGKKTYLFKLPESCKSFSSGEKNGFALTGDYESVVLPCPLEIVSDGELEDLPAEIMAETEELSAGERVIKRLTPKENEAKVEEEEAVEEEVFSGELPALPLECLPEKLARAIEGTAATLYLDHWLPFAAALKTAATLVGANILLDNGQILPGHLWLCLVGKPTVGKTAITRYFNVPVQVQQDFCSDCFLTAVEEYKIEKERYDDEKVLAKKSGVPCALKEPVYPSETIFAVDDITPEKLSSILFDNPGGVMWSCDELRGLLSSFGRYGGTGSGEAAKSRLLSMYTGESLRIDRKGQDAVRIKRGWLSIFGTVQPSILPKIFEQDDRCSGFLQRFLFIHAKKTTFVHKKFRPKAQEFQPLIDEIFGEMAIQVKRLEPRNTESKPFIVQIEDAGKELLDNFTDEIELSAIYLAGDGEDGEEEESRAGRWCEQVQRLVLLMHCIEKCSDGAQISSIISKKTVENTIKIFRVLQEHSRQAWRMIKGEKLATKNFNLLTIIDKYLDKKGAVYELRYPETIDGKKISEAILTEIGAKDTLSTPQALTKALQNLGFEKKKYNKGIKMAISKELYKKLEAKKPKKVVEPTKEKRKLPEGFEEFENLLENYF